MYTVRFTDLFNPTNFVNKQIITKLMDSLAIDKLTNYLFTGKAL